VKNSQTFCLFLTEEIFDRFWILQEMQTSVEHSIDICLVRETDSRHGALPLETLQSACPSQLRRSLFSQEVIDWHRDTHFKTVAIIKLTQRILMNDDAMKYEDAPPNIFLPRAISEMKFGSPVLLPGCNFHCYATCPVFAVDLRRGMEKINVKVTIASMQDTDTVVSRQAAIKDSSMVLALLSPGSMASSKIQEDLVFAFKQGKPVVVLHDGGLAQSEFEDVLKACPPRLGKLGLMDDLAIEWHYEQESRKVSERLICHKIVQICTQPPSASKINKAAYAPSALFAFVDAFEKNNQKMKANQVAPVRQQADEHTHQIKEDASGPGTLDQTDSDIDTALQEFSLETTTSAREI
jgi:hypothetical protein